MTIESKENKLFKYFMKLLDKKWARKENATLVESPKIVKELLANKNVVKGVILAENSKNKLNINSIACPIYYISDALAKMLSQTETTTGVFAIVDLLNLPKVIDTGRVLILDNIQDPNNFGAICRSAAAFGYNTILAINSCFAYNPKVTRCSMGNNFKLNIIECGIKEVNKYIKDFDMEVFCCDMLGKDIKNSRPTKEKFAIIIGNEGRGVSEELSMIATSTIAIPMLNNVESLNASVSASIVMYILNN